MWAERWGGIWNHSDKNLTFIKKEESQRDAGGAVINDDLPPQIHNRYEGKDISKHKRNLVIAGGVTLSVIVSPVVAAVTVGKMFSLFTFFLSHSVSQHLM